MQHSTPLIATICAGLVFAFILGAIAHRLRISPLVGYLMAGVFVGPFTPGFVADQNLAVELAEIGVILLMFGVGLHFSLKDLLSVRAVAIPGAIAQMATATLLGFGLAWLLGWSIAAGVVFGLALSVASTVVLLRSLQERRLIDTETGKIAVGWLIVEDLAMVMALVLLPAFATVATTNAQIDMAQIGEVLAWTLGKVAAFLVVMLVVGRRVIPLILHYIAHTGSRELFRLGVLAIALGVAFGAAKLFGVSFALGAFFAGMILSESPLSHRAAQESLPLRDAFAVLFFVSVGMLFDPTIVLRDPLAILATVLIILFGKSVAAFLIVRAFGHPTMTALTISASLAQIGEFSFILIGLGVALEMLPERGRDLVLAGAIISILVNPIFFSVLDMFRKRLTPAPAPEFEAQISPTPEAERQTLPIFAGSNHVVLIGFGRVGSLVGEQLQKVRSPLLVIERDADIAADLRKRGFNVLQAELEDPGDIVTAANIAAARCLVVAIPETFEAGQIIEKARAVAPRLSIIARAHSDAEITYLDNLGATAVVMGEREIARTMLGMLDQPGGEPKAPDAAAPAVEPAPVQETSGDAKPDSALPAGEGAYSPEQTESSAETRHGVIGR